MSYLNKQDRKNQIIEIAKQIVLNDGLNALTVRHLATTANISVGQVHHHFGSVSELKSTVFLNLVHINLQIEPENLDELNQLIYILGFDQTQEELCYLKLWNDAEKLMDLDSKFKPAYQEAIQLWHQAVMTVLKYGQAHGAFQFQIAHVDNIAWRLIAASCGLESIYNLGFAGMDQDFFQKNIQTFIENELQLK